MGTLARLRNSPYDTSKCKQQQVLAVHPATSAIQSMTRRCANSARSRAPCRFFCSSTSARLGTGSRTASRTASRPAAPEMAVVVLKLRSSEPSDRRRRLCGCEHTESTHCSSQAVWNLERRIERLTVVIIVVE